MAGHMVLAGRTAPLVLAVVLLDLDPTAGHIVPVVRMVGRPSPKADLDLMASRISNTRTSSVANASQSIRSGRR